MSLVARTPSVAFHTLAETLQSLGLFRNGAFKVLAGAGLALGAVSALKKASDMLSQAKLNNFTKDTYDWERELVVVTGGSGGIGAPLVRRFAAQGATVISLDIAPPKTPLPENTYFYKIDLNSNASIKEVAAQIRREHGNPTVLINNAGVSEMLCILEESEDKIYRTFHVNIISHFILLKEFLPSMVERNHGHIVTVASMRSFTAGARGADYACSKAAVLAFHEALAQEVRHQYNAPKIRTTIVHPSFVRTPIIDKVIDYAERRYTVLEPEDVADVIVKHILAGNSGQLFFPKNMWVASGLRGWPSWLQELVRDTQFSGVNPYYMRKSS